MNSEGESVQVPKSLFQAVVNYLGGRPYSEVVGLMDALKADHKIVKSDDVAGNT